MNDDMVRGTSPDTNLRRDMGLHISFDKLTQPPALSVDELNAVEGVRKEVLKHINMTLTELLDPAR